MDHGEALQVLYRHVDPTPPAPGVLTGPVPVHWSSAAVNGILNTSGEHEHPGERLRVLEAIDVLMGLGNRPMSEALREAQVRAGAASAEDEWREAETFFTALFEQIQGEASRQDEQHPEGFPLDRNGVRALITALEDEVREARDAWDAEKKPAAGVDYSRWLLTEIEVLQVAGLAFRFLRAMAEARDGARAGAEMREEIAQLESVDRNAD